MTEPTKISDKTAPRWTDETEQLVADAYAVTLGDGDDDHSSWLPDAKAILTALADAGLLVEPGGEAREEWGIRFTKYHESIRPLRTRAEAEAEILERTTRGYTYPGSPVHRTVHTGSWRAVEEATP
jgi:hypothetical protein